MKMKVAYQPPYLILSLYDETDQPVPALTILYPAGQKLKCIFC